MRTKTILVLLWIFALTYWNVIVWQKLLSSKEENLTVAFLDVGQGDAIFIEAPNGNQMLIDGGEDKDVVNELKSIMPRIDTSIDIVLATHSDSDHIGGLDDVLHQYRVSYVLDNGRDDKDTHTFTAFEKEIQNEMNVSRAQYIKAQSGMRIILDKDKKVYFDVYYPAASSTASNSNELSVVGKLVYGEAEVLLTGDAGLEVEQKLLAWCASCLASDVLKVGHHGSKTSTGEVFIDAVKPHYAIISAEADNTYGHPHKDVMSRLANIEATILETAKSGTIILESDGKEVRVR